LKLVKIELAQRFKSQFSADYQGTSKSLFSTGEEIFQHQKSTGLGKAQVSKGSHGLGTKDGPLRVLDNKRSESSGFGRLVETGWLFVDAKVDGPCKCC
jgi:hypothetical protein